MSYFIQNDRTCSQFAACTLSQFHFLKPKRRVLAISLVSYTFVRVVYQMFLQTYSEYLQDYVEEDNFNLAPQYWPENTDIEFSRWKHVFPYDTVNDIIFKLIRTEMTIACFLAFLDSGLGFAGPILVKYILLYLNSKDETLAYREQAYALAGLWLIFYFIKIFVREYWIRIAEMAATKVEITLETQLYRKITTVSGTYRRYINPGQFFAYWFIDVSTVTSCITSFPTIIGSPTTLILAVIFVCVQIGSVGLLLLLVILIAIVIELLLDLQMSRVYNHKLLFYDNRMIQNNHMWKNFLQLKCLGWQKMFISRNIGLRDPQNKMNKIYYLLMQIYLFVCNFTPYFVILILLLFEQNVYKENWNVTTIYAIISYLSVIATPLIQLPSTIVKILQYKDVFYRIDNFFKAENISKTKDFYVANGTIEFDNPVFSIGTISSIKRIIVKQSLFVRKKKYMHSTLKTMPLEVRLFDIFQFMSEEETRKFCMYLKCLSIPSKLTFKNGDKIALISSRSGSGRTSFIRSFLGTLGLQSGSMKYGGKIGYSSASNFFINDTIRQNVLFGEPYNQARLKNAYKVSGLCYQLQKFTKRDLTIVNKSPYVLSKIQKQLISLARAIYSNCDILIFDDFVSKFQIDRAYEVHRRIREYFAKRVMIFTTEVLYNLYPTDKIVIIQNRVVAEVGTYGEMINNPKSGIHKFKTNDFQLIHYQNIIKAKGSKCKQSDIIEYFDEDEDEDEGVFSPIKSPKQRSEICLVQQTQNLLKPDNLPQTRLKSTVLPYDRPGPVQFKYYVMLFRNGGFIYLFTFIFILIAIGLQTFGTWLVGSLNKQPFGLSYEKAVVLYACVQLGNGIALLAFGVFLPRVITRVIQIISNSLNTILCKNSIQGSVLPGTYILFCFGNDLQLFYTTIDCITAMFSNFAMLISVVVIMGITSYIIWIIASIVMIYTMLCYLQYRRTYQQTYVSAGQTKRYYTQALEDYVTGIETIQFYDKIEWFRARVFDGIYFFSGIYKANLNYVNHSFNILCGFSVITLTAGILFLALRSKDLTSSHMIYTNVAVSALPKLLTNVMGLFNNLSNMVKQMMITQKAPFQVLKNPQKDFDTPQKPVNWPENGNIQFKNVIFERQQKTTPIIDHLSFTISSGEIIGMYGDENNDVHILFHLLNGLIRPQTLDKRPAGSIFIAGVDIATIGQTYITENVLLIDSAPSGFTGTVRYNLDPFNKYQDSEVSEALRTVGFWKEIQQLKQRDQILLDPFFGTLNFQIDERGQYLSSSIIQKLSIARAILKKPKILLLDRSLSRLQPAVIYKFYSLIRRSLKNVTVIHLTYSLNFLLRCDRIMCFKDGKIVQQGKPWEMAVNQITRFHNMIRHSTQTEKHVMTHKKKKEKRKTFT